MARGIEGNEIATPRPPKQPKPTPQSSNQKTLFGFFQKLPANANSAAVKLEPSSSLPPVATLTPAPSSDAALPPSSPPRSLQASQPKAIGRGLPSPVSPASSDIIADRSKSAAAAHPQISSPSRGAKKRVNYAESDDEDEIGHAANGVSKTPSPNTANSRSAKRRRTVLDDSDDDFEAAAAAALASASEDGLLPLSPRRLTLLADTRHRH